RTTKSAAQARVSGAGELPQEAKVRPLNIPERDKSPVKRTTTARDKSRAGSARAEKVTSRLAPIPSKLEPVSRAASTVKKRPSARRAAKKTRSAGKASKAALPPRGTSKD